jgi:glutamate racemase
VFRELLGQQVQLVETGQPVARQTRRLLEQQALLNPRGEGKVQWQTSGSQEALQGAAARWLGL